MQPLEKILNFPVSEFVKFYRDALLNIISPYELFGIARNLATHLNHFADGKQSKKWEDNSHYNPVLLLHGYFQNDSSFAGVKLRILDALGGEESPLGRIYKMLTTKIDGFRLGPLEIKQDELVVKGLEDYLYKYNIMVDRPSHGFYRDLSVIAEEILHRAEKIQRKIGKKVDIVGHSLGGLVAIIAATKNPKLFQRVVTLSIPYRGTVMANIAYFLTLGMAGKSAEQMRTYSRFTENLTSNQLPEKIMFYNFIAERDLLIRPLKNAALDDAPNVINKIVKGVGHIGITGPRAYPLVLAALRDKLYTLGINDRKRNEVRDWMRRNGWYKPYSNSKN